VGALETFRDGDLLEPSRHDETADVILNPAFDRRDEIRQRHVRPSVTLRGLLTQRIEGSKFFLAPLVLEQPDIVTDAARRPESDDGMGAEPFFRNDLIEHGLRIRIERTGGLALFLVFKDRGEAALEPPGLEERRPVDIAGKLREIVVLEFL